MAHKQPSEMIAEIRETLGLNQGHLARHFRVSQATISKYEGNRVRRKDMRIVRGLEDILSGRVVVDTSVPIGPVLSRTQALDRISQLLLEFSDREDRRELKLHVHAYAEHIVDLFYGSSSESPLSDVPSKVGDNPDENAGGILPLGSEGGGSEGGGNKKTKREA